MKGLRPVVLMYDVECALDLERSLSFSGTTVIVTNHMSSKCDLLEHNMDGMDYSN